MWTPAVGDEVAPGDVIYIAVHYVCSASSSSKSLRLVWVTGTMDAVDVPQGPSPVPQPQQVSPLWGKRDKDRGSRRRQKSTAFMQYVSGPCSVNEGQLLDAPPVAAPRAAQASGP